MQMQKLKERLFGITVVVSLSVIFVPMLLTGNDETKLTLAQSIPEQPDASFSNLAHIQLAHYNVSSDDNLVYEHDLYYETPELISEPTQQVVKEKETVSSVVPKIKVEPKVTSKPLVSKIPESVGKKSVKAQAVKQVHQAWVVRLATFGNPKNAEKLSARLKQDGYNAYTRSSKRTDKDYTFVLVGPNVEKQAAKKLNDDLQFKYNLKGMVIKHQPETRG